MQAHALLLMAGLAMTAGVAAQVVAERVGLPGIVVLLGVGVQLGPEVLDLVHPGAPGAGLRVLVALMG